jgi:hypothetical protein
MQNRAAVSKPFEEKAKGQKLQGMTDEQGGEKEQDPGRVTKQNNKMVAERRGFRLRRVCAAVLNSWCASYRTCKR